VNSTNVERFFMAMFRFSEDSGLVVRSKVKSGWVWCGSVQFGKVRIVVWFGSVMWSVVGWCSVE